MMPRTPDSDVLSAAYQRSLDAVGPMPPVSIAEQTPAPIRAERRLARYRRSARVRSHWWYPSVVIGLLLATFLAVLQLDQRLSEWFIWPQQGAQFRQINALVSDEEKLPNMVIVVGGFNRRDGDSIAESLLPSLQDSQTRVFSLVYGSGIYDGDIAAKFDELYKAYQPERVDFFGSSMGGDVVLRLAAYISTTYPATVESADSEGSGDGEDSDNSGSDVAASGVAGSDPTVGADGDAADAGSVAGGDSDPVADGAVADGEVDETEPAIIPLVVGNIYLDCTPLSDADLRTGQRAKAEFLRGLTEALQTDGGGGVRIAAEMLAKKDQWSSGEFPYLQIDGDEFWYKFQEIRREKVNVRGVSTLLIKDQYAVIRQFDSDLILGQLAAGTRILYFLPEERTNDFTVNVGQVEGKLTAYAQQLPLSIQIAAIEGGFHASATRNQEQYNSLIEDFETADVVDSR